MDPDKIGEILGQIGGPPGTGPGDWRWYCRLCGARGVADDEQGRDENAFGHADHVRGLSASSGRLLHVW